jgi:hypothetical protein
MTLDLSINPHLAIARERIYQDYVYECQVLLIDMPSLAEKLAHVNVDVSKIYDKRFEEKFDFPMTSRVTMNSNHSNMVRSGISTKNYRQFNISFKFQGNWNKKLLD